jgi:hypothetical protein
MMANTMTGARHERKPPFSNFRPGLAAVLLGVLALIGPSGAATTEQVVVDRHTGLAISGFDPVAYFTDGIPSLGRPDFEYRFAGAVWRFRNEGNRACFLAHPEIYGPQFGGYDPTDLARGVTVAGNPRLWLLAGERLYLFGREETRDAFAADPAHLLREANARWPQLRQNLAR